MSTTDAAGESGIDGMDAHRMDGRVAVVSGAGTFGGEGVGNGAATARLLADRGASVVLVDREVEWAAATREAIEGDEGDAIAVEADVTDPAACEAVVERAADEFGRLDVVHSNVGGGPRDNVVDATDEDWRGSIALNLMSVINMCRHAVPIMAEDGGGAIVTTASTQARRPGFDYLPYVTTKAAVEGITRGLAMDHAAAGIRANCVVPGPIWTPRIASTRDEEDRRVRRESVPIPREGEPWDVGQAAAFLASDAAGWITGVSLPVDGGLLLTRAGDRPGIF